MLEHSSTDNCQSDSIAAKAAAWTQEPFDSQTQETVKEWIDHDPVELRDGFWKDLEFGTGGMRGLMGVGTSRMNIYTVQKATQGLCNWLNRQPQKKSAVIAYDSRHHSKEFALDAARVFAANGIQAFIFKHLRPIPVLSFAIRHLEADCGVMITASHNPSDYNGFKVYNSEGCQVYAPDDKDIVDQVNLCDYHTIKISEHDDSLICHLDDSIDQAYVYEMAKQQQTPEVNKASGHQLKVVYTSLHGTGITLAPQALYHWGFSQVHILEEQAIPHGDFPTVTAPNPEDPSAMEMGVQQLLAREADLVLANDPDADRLGVGVRFDNRCKLLNGQEIAILLMDHLLRFRSLTGHEAAIKSLVTTDLVAEICKAYHIPCFDVLPGFKFIGRLIKQWQEESSYQFIFGAEESHGYLSGLHARDKDGIIAACLIAEAALNCKLEGITLIERLEQIYELYGRYSHFLMTINQSESMSGQERIAQMMRTCRAAPPKQLAGFELSSIKDLSLPPVPEPLLPSNVLLWKFEESISLIIRPSGTEPKIKLYLSIKHSEKIADPILCAQSFEAELRQYLV